MDAATPGSAASSSSGPTVQLKDLLEALSMLDFSSEEGEEVTQEVAGGYAEEQEDEEERVEEEGGVDNSAGASSQGFEQRVDVLATTLEVVEEQCTSLTRRVQQAEEENRRADTRLKQSEITCQELKTQLQLSSDREELLAHEVARLEAVLEAERLQSRFYAQRLQESLLEERQRTDRLRLARDDASRQRDEAMAEVALLCADVEALQCTLDDSAAYVRFLRRRVVELEEEAAAAGAQAAAAAAAAAAASSTCIRRSGVGQGGSDSDAVFSLASVRAEVLAAVRDAFSCGDISERRQRLRALQLRWHPDKNPVLRQLSTEVTKIINHAVAKHEETTAAAAAAAAAAAVPTAKPAAAAAAAAGGSQPSGGDGHGIRDTWMPRDT